MRLNIQLFANEISTTSTSVTIGDTIRVNITTDSSYKVTLMFYVYDSKTDPEIIDTSSYITGNYYDYTVKENVYDVLKGTTGTLSISGMVESYQGDFIGFTNDINLTLTVPKLPTKLVNVNKTVSALAIGGKSTAKDDEELFENYMASKFYKDIEATNVVSRNLFNKNANTIVAYSVSPSSLNNGVRITTNNVANNSFAVYKLSNDLLGKTITLTSNIIASSTNQGIARLFYGTDSNPAITNIGDLTSSGSITRDIATSFPSDTNGIYLLLYGNRSGSGFNVGSYVDYTNLQIEEGSATDYVPYLNLQETILKDSVARLNNVVSRNLLNKNNANIVKGYSSSSEVIGGGTGRLIYIPCEPNTTYTIQKIASNRFILSCSESKPAIGTPVTRLKNAHPQTVATVTTNNTANYLIVDYFDSDTDEQSILDSIQIEEGSTATPYVPYLNLEEAMKEKDPIFKSSPAYNITQNDIEKWNNNTGGSTDKYKKVFVHGAGYVSTPTYYLLAKLPASTSSTADILNIKGYLGGYASNEQAVIDVQIGNRGGLSCNGTWIGVSSYAFVFSRLRLYTSNGETYVYLMANGWCGNVRLEVSGMWNEIYDTFPATTTPVGTLVLDVNEKVLSKTSDLFYRSGHTYSVDYMLMPGHITGGSASLQVIVTVPKRLDNITSISCTSLSVESRGIKGYLNSASGFIEYVGKSGYTITCTKLSENTVGIVVVKSSAFTNCTNNTPIVLWGKVSLTFS